MYASITPYETHRACLPFVLKARGLLEEGVEVGVCQGLFSRVILAHWPGFLYLVDPWEDYAAYSEKHAHKENYEATLRNIDEYRDRCRVVRKPSIKASADFSSNSLDFVYLDANHSYEAVKEDLEAWYPKVKRGGILAGDDYGLFPETKVNFGNGELKFGVKKAVDEFALRNQKNVSIDWLGDWDCAYLMSDGTKHSCRARNWWFVK